MKLKQMLVLKLNWWINHKKENLVNDVQNPVTIIANLKICNLATKSEDKRTADNYRESSFINYFIIDVQYLAEKDMNVNEHRELLFPTQKKSQNKSTNVSCICLFSKQA